MRGGTLLGAMRSPTSGSAPGMWGINESVAYKREKRWVPSGDANASSVCLLLPCNGANGSTSFVDFSPLGVPVLSTGSAQISTAESKWGGSSGSFTTSSDSLVLEDPLLGTGAFTIETWIKSNGAVQYAQLIGNENPSGYTLLLNNNSATGGQIALYVNGVLTATSSSGDWTDNAWHHIALTRSGNTFTIWGDGVSRGTGTSAASLNGGEFAYIGRNNQYSPRNLAMSINDFRITKGVARYTGSFTTPPAAFL